MQNAILADRIKKECKRNSITLKELLQQCGMNRNTMYDLEKKGSFPTAEKISRMADTLNSSVDYLLGRTADLQSSNESDPLLSKISVLNDLGRQKASEYIKDLTENPRYRINAPEDVKIVAQKKPEKLSIPDEPKLI